MKVQRLSLLILTGCLFNACSTPGSEATLSSLEKRKWQTTDIPATSIDNDKVTHLYRDFLRYPGNQPMQAEVIRRLADLQIDKAETNGVSRGKHTSQEVKESIRLYQAFLHSYPQHHNREYILYQLARAYELDEQTDNMLDTLAVILKEYPSSELVDEIQFRRGETFFQLHRFPQAVQAYQVILGNPDSVFYTTALYKYGWSQFKQEHYPASLQTFIRMLDEQYQHGMLDKEGNIITTSSSQQELINDVLRVISLAFSYQEGTLSIKSFFRENGPRDYEPLIYQNLAELHHAKDRMRDAAQVYLSFTEQYPYSGKSPLFHQRAIDAYHQGKFFEDALNSRVLFTRKYAVNSSFWKQQTVSTQESIAPLLQQHLRELALYFHSRAKKNKQHQDFQQASGLYRDFLRSFPNEKQSAEINFLLAECYQDQKKYLDAIREFQSTAYNYPQHDKMSEAAYAALLLYPEVEKNRPIAEAALLRHQHIDSAMKFAASFPRHPHRDTILANTAEQLFAMKDYQRASATARQLITSSQEPRLTQASLLVLGHSEFEMKNYAEAENIYRQLARQLKSADRNYQPIRDKLAASIYQQGEEARKKYDYALAAFHYLRVKQHAPESKLVATAEYDAASACIRLQQWDRAKTILLNFRSQQSKNHPLQTGISEKLVLVYEKTDQPVHAAYEIEHLSYLATGQYSNDQKRELLWQAIGTYDKHKHGSNKLRALANYIRLYPQPLENAIEAHYLLAQEQLSQGMQKQYFSTLEKIISLDSKGQQQRTVRTRSLAAAATMKLAEPALDSYRNTRLRLPLKNSLQKKKILMEKCITAYQRAIDYRVAEVTTEATFQLAEIYHDLARSLLTSDRPKGLNADELEEYTVLLEEQSFPFEEKAIEIHIANATRVRDGLYDNWVAKSITMLAKLNPVRYGKSEKVENYVATIY